MAAGRYDFVIDQGQDFSKQFTITQSDSSLLPSTGWNARAEMRSNKNPSSPIAATFTCTFDADGVVVISLTKAQTEALTAGKYYYDLEIYPDNDATSKRYLEGEIEVTQSITRG